MRILKIIFKNAFRHKLRTGLTILSITIAILAFGLLRTVVDAWYAGAQASSAYRLVTRSATSILFPCPSHTKKKSVRSMGYKLFPMDTGLAAFILRKKTFLPTSPWN
jgi:putative ABC transport system permease protein